MVTARKRLIVNADDYGYYPFVTDGILEGIDEGVITATGLFANSETFSRDIRLLKERSHVDVGVHLNLTWGEPITAAMRRCLSRSGGHFVDKWQTIAMLAGSEGARNSAREEISAQVQRCFDEGLEVRFLNAHEHMHLLPSIGTAVQRVAKQMNIRYVRRSGSEQNAGVSGISPGFKGRLFDALAGFQPGLTADQPHLLGLGCSGALTSKYLEMVLPQLMGREVYELMCHPGGNAEGSLKIPHRHKSYHDWVGEKSLLVSPHFKELLASHDIQVTRFRDLHQEEVT